MFIEMFPILTTRDLDRSLTFYRDLLGGTVEFQFPDDGPAVYVGVNIGRNHIGIGWAPDSSEDAAAQRFSLWLYTDDCDRAVADLSAAGVPVLSEPEDQPWGERVARVTDPDGNVMVIGQRAAAAGS